MEANTEESTTNIPPCPYARSHQKRVSNDYFINQNLQNLASNTVNTSKIHVILSPNSLQIVANQMY
jgi:hypothetical protein